MTSDHFRSAGDLRNDKNNAHILGEQMYQGVDSDHLISWVLGTYFLERDVCQKAISNGDGPYDIDTYFL